MPYALPVLMYHSISNAKHYLCVSPERFEEHCRALAEAGWRGISLAEAEAYFLKKKKLPAKTCLLTFDDGYFDNYTHAEPLLRRYGHHGVIFPVVNMLENSKTLRPNIETANTDPGKATQLAKLLQRRQEMRMGRKVAKITFCSWLELSHMGKEGNMDAAPHSLGHDRVVVNLDIKHLYKPKAGNGFFAVPPYEVPYGFPIFQLGHALEDRAYKLSPKIFDLVRGMVPQQMDEAVAYLNNPANCEAVIRAVNALPSLAIRESEGEYRQRIANDFTRCRELFMEKLGITPVSFCWPWGGYNKTALEEARKAGFRLFFATGGKPSFLSTANAVSRIAIRDHSAEQLLQKLRFASGNVVEGVGGWLRALPGRA